jgi:hypothetical protein
MASISTDNWLMRARWLLTAGLLLVAGVTGAETAPLLERLRIDHAAMVSAEQDYHAQRRDGTLSGAEAADYAAYVARLHRLVAEDCVALAEVGLALPTDLGCSAVRPPMLAPAAIDQSRELTTDEQIAVLDAELRNGLGEFDEMLLREQERVRAATPMTDAASGTASGAGDSGTGEGSAGDGESAAPADAGSEGSAGQRDQTEVAAQGQRDQAGAGAQRQSARQGVPPDIPDGSDDDVVARQLREAAEKERDPELKKRLWEEYRKYKAGTR